MVFSMSLSISSLALRWGEVQSRIGDRLFSTFRLTCSVYRVCSFRLIRVTAVPTSPLSFCRRDAGSPRTCSSCSGLTTRNTNWGGRRCRRDPGSPRRAARSLDCRHRKSVSPPWSRLRPCQPESWRSTDPPPPESCRSLSRRPAVANHYRNCVWKSRLPVVMVERGAHDGRTWCQNGLQILFIRILPPVLSRKSKRPAARPEQSVRIDFTNKRTSIRSQPCAEHGIWEWIIDPVTGARDVSTPNATKNNRSYDCPESLTVLNRSILYDRHHDARVDDAIWMNLRCSVTLNCLGRYRRFHICFNIVINNVPRFDLAGRARTKTVSSLRNRPIFNSYRHQVS